LLASIEREETDEGLTAARKGVERLCLATREVRPVEEMIRYVAGPDGTVVPDLERKLPGRGAWVTGTREALERAVRERVFSRVFRGKGDAGAELPDLVERLLERSAIEAISLTNKAGRVVTGATRVAAALTEQEVAVLVHASDAAADGVRKLEALADATESAGKKRPSSIRAFRGEQLDLALGRPNVVHAALLAHPASAGFLARYFRLDRWRGGKPAGAAALPGGKHRH
jgi:predicted RNA-binding protein YlxR (DUF448 family)